ncbi:hypothetical protein DPMN_032368 [Dreissena polymorpha]|uniref:Uncharacterized protein n=1 Tax=Dreissena polymorpha TaxID=45954 RepID=A0A9D4RJZ9_DREPO|nr:hypothetical protein DPMN_032368 [Dreissena polymorpha]
MIRLRSRHHRLNAHMHTNTDWHRHRPVRVAQKTKQLNTSSKDANVTTRSELQSDPRTQPSTRNPKETWMTLDGPRH